MNKPLGRKGASRRSQSESWACKKILWLAPGVSRSTGTKCRKPQNRRYWEIFARRPSRTTRLVSDQSPPGSKDYRYQTSWTTSFLWWEKH